MKRKTFAAFGILMLVLSLALSGCGGKPKADVSVFFMGPQGVPQEVNDKLAAGLKAAVGASPTIDFTSTPLFNLEKMIVEIAAGDHDILILPSDQFVNLAKQSGLVPLDNLFNKDDYKAGIVESNDQGKVETHLYGVPLDDSKWFKNQGLTGKGLVAFIPGNSKHQDYAKKVIQIMAAK